MPGWHARTRELVEAGELVLLGVIQEQHAQRCRLFAQWQEFDWPIVQDPINRLANSAVPIAIAIDEQGVVRSTRPSPDWLLGEFRESKPDETTVDQGVKAPETADSLSPGPKSLIDLRQRAENAPSVSAWINLGDAIVLWERENNIDEAIAAYQKAIELDEKTGQGHFRLGVAYRYRYEQSGETSDFRAAAEAWSTALEINPNQYIWRRRIQQYGPRLSKPYPFYDWVDQAVAEVSARGEKPIELKVPLTLAEVAKPQRRWEATEASTENPDPQAKIQGDAEKLVQIEGAVVPAKATRGGAARVHVDFIPDQIKKVHWTNDAGPLVVWIDGPEGGEPGQQLFEVTSAKAETTTERRRIEVEIKVSPDAGDTIQVRGYALYYVCEDIDGECVYRRGEFVVDVPVVDPPRRRR